MVAQAQQDQPQQQTQITPPSAPTQKSAPKPKRNIVLTIALVLLFLLMAGGLGYLGYQNYQLRQKLENMSTVEESGSSARVYSTQKDGYSFELPAGWDTYELGDSLMVAPQDRINEVAAAQGGFGGGNFLTIIISDHPPGDPLLVWESNEGQEVDSEEITVAGKKATKYNILITEPTPGSSVGDEYIDVVVENEGKYLSINLLDSQYKKQFEQILSSFEFIPSTYVLPEPSISIDTSSWTVYENDSVSFKTNRPQTVVEGGYQVASGDFITVSGEQTLDPNSLPLLEQNCDMEADPYCLIPGENWGQNNDTQEYLIDDAIFSSYYISDNVNNSVIHVVYSEDENIEIATPVDGVLLEDEFLALLSTLEVK